ADKRMCGQHGYVLAEELVPAAGDAHLARDESEQGGLARSVRPNDRPALALGDAQRHIAHRLQAAERPGDAVQLESVARCAFRVARWIRQRVSLVHLHLIFPTIGERRAKPQRTTHNAQRTTRNAQRATRNAQRATRNPQPGTRNPEPGTRNHDYWMPSDFS